MSAGNVARVSFRPTAEHKRRALIRVRLEMEQVLSLLTRLHATPASDVVLRRALLERLVVHLRTILAFLELSERTVHYSGGLRHENDDILGIDYDFPAERLSISEEDRRELRRTRIALSYSTADLFSTRMPTALLTLTVPVLRRCAAFARHVLQRGSAELDQADVGEWTQLQDSLEIFASRNA